MVAAVVSKWWWFVDAGVRWDGIDEPGISRSRKLPGQGVTKRKKSVTLQKDCKKGGYRGQGALGRAVEIAEKSLSGLRREKNRGDEKVTGRLRGEADKRGTLSAPVWGSEALPVDGSGYVLGCHRQAARQAKQVWRSATTSVVRAATVSYRPTRRPSTAPVVGNGRPVVHWKFCVVPPPLPPRASPPGHSQAATKLPTVGKSSDSAQLHCNARTRSPKKGNAGSISRPPTPTPPPSPPLHFSPSAFCFSSSSAPNHHFAEHPSCYSPSDSRRPLSDRTKNYVAYTTTGFLAFPTVTMPPAKLSAKDDKADGSKAATGSAKMRRNASQPGSAQGREPALAPTSAPSQPVTEAPAPAVSFCLVPSTLPPCPANLWFRAAAQLVYLRTRRPPRVPPRT